MAKILIVDDDPRIVQLLEDVLQRDYLTVFAHDGRGALHQLVAERPDLVLLDLRMPDMDGSVLLPRIRALSSVPIIVLSGRADQSDRVPALRHGADDFIAKPFELEDLLTRIATVLRRCARVPVETGVITVGNLVISPVHGTVTVGGQPVQVTPTEWRILTALAIAQGETLSHANLSLAAYGYAAQAETQRAIYTHVLHLRLKLLTASPDAPRIMGLHRAGYMLA